MVVFEKVSPENTEPTLQLAIEKATELSTDLVISSTTGDSALKALDLIEKSGFSGRLIVVTHAWGAKKIGENSMPNETMELLRNRGAVLVTAAHALSGAERSISTTFKGAYPLEIIAQTLRMFSQGTKVCVEIGAMAMDAGVLAFNQVYVFAGGSDRGLDTACVLRPCYSAKLFSSRVIEMLCKPQ